LLLARPRGMILIRDELAGLFGNFNRYSRGSDRPFWLQAWNGGRYVIERVSGSTVVDHLLVGIVGSFQPELSRAFLGDEDGMCGRFLYAWPSPPRYRPLTNDTSEVESEFLNALLALTRLPSEDVRGGFVPRDVWLSKDAIAKFEEFRQWIHKKRLELDGHEQQWAGKGESAVLRLAGTLAYMDWAIALSATLSGGIDVIAQSLEPEFIEAEFVAAAIRLWSEFFSPHARAALRQIGLSDGQTNERRVLRWLQANHKSEISREEVRREALGQKLNAEKTQQLLDGLVKAGWLRKQTTKTAGRAIHRWSVNERLFRCDAESAGRAESA